MPSDQSQQHENQAPASPKKAGTWQAMVDSNKALLLRKTGKDTAHWAEKARAAGIENDSELRAWMRDNFGVTGYAQYAVSWEMFGYPEFMLRDADELIDGQYASHPRLRPIADALLAWASATDGVAIQMRKAMCRSTARGASSPRSPAPRTQPWTSPSGSMPLRTDGSKPSGPVRTIHSSARSA
ncbi:MAG: hypothetical protein ACLGIS_17150 [Actinomycetes bacterium]